MISETQLAKRADNKCELCQSTSDLSVYTLPNASERSEQTSVLLCLSCRDQIEGSAELDVNHWRCLGNSMWSEHLPVQVLSYGMLTHLKTHGWAQDMIDQLYLDEASIEWAKSIFPDGSDLSSAPATKDSNGATLSDGDSVTLIKDLDVKGAGFTAKRGTLVKNISLTNNPMHVEGKVSGVQIVLVAAYLKKAT